MEKSRAIELLEHLAWDRDIDRNPYGDALNMAIDALKAQLSQEGTTSDTISRQAAIDALAEQMPTPYTPDGSHPADEQIFQAQEVYADCITTLESLPSVQPEPQEGHWIPHESPDGGEQYECSQCGVLWEFNDGTPEDNEAYFCPKCGKKLITK
jgi:DNA-directed RNA polymerase subunit RPC12/RpoP